MCLLEKKKFISTLHQAYSRERLLLIILSKMTVVLGSGDARASGVSRRYVPARTYSVTLYEPSQFTVSLSCSPTHATASV